MTEGALRNLLRGGLPRFDSLLGISDASGYTIEWLATGEGPKRRSEVRELPAGYAIAVQGAEEASALAEDFALVPRYDVEVSAGHGTFAEDGPPASWVVRVIRT